jgi:hypothetical protein
LHGGSPAPILFAPALVAPIPIPFAVDGDSGSGYGEGEPISAANARTRLGQIIDRAVERNGEPVVLILSLTDFVKTLAPAPDWLKGIQGHAERHGIDNLTMDDIDAEIAAARRERRERQRHPGR